MDTFNNGRPGLSVAVWLHRLKFVSVGVGCCGLSQTLALSVVTALLRAAEYALMWHCISEL